MASNSKLSSLIRPEIRLVRAFMPVLVTSNFDDDSIKMNELALRHHFPIISLWEIFRRLRAANSVVWSGPKSNTSKLLCLSWLPATLMMIRSKMNELAWKQLFPIISLWEIFRCSRAANSVVSGPIWPKFELVWDVIHVLVTCKYKKDRIKNKKRWRHRFPHYKSMGAFCCHGNQTFNPMCFQTLCSLSLTPVMLRIKFDQDWPTGFRDIQVWKCGRRSTTDEGRTTDHWYTISSHCEPSTQVS